MSGYFVRYKMNNEQLIKEVLARKPLWDKSDKRHHNRFVLDRMWDEIANEMKKSRDEVRKKWKNLRDRFRIELRKYPPPALENGPASENKEEDSDVVDSTWPYYQAMMFVKDQFSQREIKGEAMKIEPAAESSSSSGPDPSSLIPEQALFEVTPQDASPPASLDAEVPDKNKKPRYSYGKRTYDLLNDSNNDMLFFESLLPHIAKLSDQQKMLMMMEIQQCVYRHVYGGPAAHSSETFLCDVGSTANHDEKMQRYSD